jgi:uncharacterized repeat protein (TIGR01451 family)
VTVNPDGSFSYSPPPGAFFTDSFGYTVTDANGDYVTGTATVVVQAIPQAITFTTAPPSPALVGGSYTPAATGGGSGNPVVFGIDPFSVGVCSLSNGVVSLGAAGTCVLDASQAGGELYGPGQASQIFTDDQSPSFVLAAPPLPATAGHPYSYTFAASGTPVPSYALAAGAPSWLSVNAITGTVSGTPPSGTTSFSYQVTATSAAGTASAGPFTVTVSPSPRADLTVSLSCPRTLTVGGTGNCVLTVRNRGPQTATGVTAGVSLPARLAEVSCSATCAHHRNVYTWRLGTRAAGGAAVTRTITVQAVRAGPAVVSATVDSAQTDPQPANNFATGTIAIK